MKVTVIIQARMASTRLPGKVMKEVLGKPLLSYLIERIRCCKGVKDIILATTLNPEDDSIATLGRNEGVKVFKGSENNVLERFHEAATMFGAMHIMRITADCPFIDPDFLYMLIKYYFAENPDYTNNCTCPTLPDGLDAEIFNFETLDYAYKHALLPSELEHVTPYIQSHPEFFKILNWTHHDDLSHLRWTVDKPEDLEFVRQVIESIYPGNKNFRTKDILDLLYQRPELVKINADFTRNEGYLPSLEVDKKLFDSGNHTFASRNFAARKAED